MRSSYRSWRRLLRNGRRGLFVAVGLLLAIGSLLGLLIGRLFRIAVWLRRIGFATLLRLIITIILGFSVGRIASVLLAWLLRLVGLLRLLLVLSRWL